MRLARFLAHAGVASRRSAEKLIAEGRVVVDGAPVTDPATDVSDTNRITVDGRPVGAEPSETWALNKPAGVVSTAREPGSRPAVTEFVDSSARLYPVGRLDADSTGLILLTNDGELANRLTHPRFEVPKTYLARLRRPPANSDLERLRRGVELDDGPTAPALVQRLSETEIEITIHEGRNRQVRRMAEAIGNVVVSLERVRLGSLELGGLRSGETRRLTEEELKRLWEDAAVSTEERLFAVRGAIQVDANDAQAIRAATTELIGELISRNDLEPQRMVSCLFTSTADLDAEFPAAAARDLGLGSVPLLCAQEIEVPGSMQRVIRVMVHYYGPADSRPAHTYLGEAQNLRVDLEAAQ